MRAYAALYAPYNDIDIFVEDGTLCGLYERTFKQLLEGRAKLAAVIPLGGKKGVIDEAKRLRGDGTRKRFFLLDGDFDWSVGRMSKIPNLYYSRCYSFENLAWDYSLIIKVAEVLAPDLSTAAIQARLPQRSLDRHVEMLLPLFILYATCMSLKSSVPTISYPLARLMVNGQHCQLCSKALAHRIRDVYRQLATNHSIERIRTERRKVQATVKRRKAHDARFLSGKDYLMPIILREFQGLFRFRGTKNQLLSMILQAPNYSVDPGLRDAVLRAAA